MFLPYYNLNNNIQKVTTTTITKIINGNITTSTSTSTNKIYIPKIIYKNYNKISNKKLNLIENDYILI